jgi:hypothetical protein
LSKPHLKKRVNILASHPLKMGPDCRKVSRV